MREEPQQVESGGIEIPRIELQSMPAFSNWRSSRTLLLLVATLAACVLALRWNWIATAVPVFLVIGIVQYHFSVALHEATHYGLFRPRRLNDLAARIIGLFLGVHFEAFRASHLVHHASLGFDNDSDWDYYQVTGRNNSLFRVFRWLLVKGTFVELLGRHAARLRHGADKAGGAVDSMKALRHLALVALCQVPIFLCFGAWWHYFVFWAAPIVTIPGFLNIARTFGEHAGLRSGESAQGQAAGLSRAHPRCRPGWKNW